MTPSSKCSSFTEKKKKEERLLVIHHLQCGNADDPLGLMNHKMAVHFYKRGSLAKRLLPIIRGGSHATTEVNRKGIVPKRSA